MLVRQLEIKRFRCVREDSLDCDSLTALVGRNGAGKSCFLHALRLFYAVAPTVTDEDFYNRETGEPIQIRVTFGQLLPEEMDAFSSYVDGQELIVTKRIWWNEGKPQAKTYGASRQHPEFATIRAMPGKTDRKNAFKGLVDGGTIAGLQGAKTADDAEGKMKEWETTNPAACRPIEREAQFIGPASIGVGALDSFTKFVFVPAVRDVGDEAGDGKGSALAALLDLVVNDRMDNRPDLQELRELVKTKYEEIFAAGNQLELQALAGEISRVLTDFHPGSSVVLGWRAAAPPELALPSVDPTLIEDGFKGHVSRKGHGLQRALVLALLQARAKTTAPPPTPENGQPAAAQGADAAGPRRRLILAIEEPELYQHPQQCRHWAKVLRRITEPPNGQELSDTQVIFATHSPQFVDLSWFDQVRILRKVVAGPGLPPVAKAQSTTLSAVGQELETAANRPLGDFTAQTTKARSRPVMTNLVNEGFFASVAVLVEGGTEVGIIQEIARLKGKDWDAKGIAIIDVGGKTKLDKPLVVFRRLGIPTYLVFDGDADKESDDRKKQNRLLLRLLHETEVDYPPTGAHTCHAVMHENIERELKTVLSAAVYDRIAGAVAVELGYDGASKAMKNVDAASLFASRVYDEGLALPVLEGIVEQATALAPVLEAVMTATN